MRYSIYIFLFGLLIASPAFSQKEKKLKKEAKESAIFLSGKEQHPYIDKFHEAIREKLSGNLNEAKKLFQECLKMRKDDDAVYFALASIAKEEKQTSAALDYIEKAYEIDPGNITYLKELAYANYERSNFEKAEGLFKEMCEREPRNIDFLYGYSNVLIYNRNYKEAINQLNNLQSQTGTVPELSMMVADLYSEIKDEKNAEATIIKLKEEFPHDQEVLKKVIGYYEQKDEKEKAIQLIEELVEKDPENGMALFILANNYLALEQKQKFIDIAERVIQNKSVDVENKLFTFEHLNYFAEEKDYDKVFNSAKSLFEQYPNDENVAINYGSLLVRNHRSKEALTIFRGATKDNVNDYETWARILLFESDFKEYEALYEDGLKAVSLFPAHPFLYYLAAEGALKTNRPDEAGDLLAGGEIYIIDDRVEKARYAMRKGEIEFHNKAYRKGIVHFEEALSIHTDATIQTTYALALCRANIALDAAQDMLKAINEDERTMDFYYAEGLYYLLQKQYKKGIKSVESGIEKVFNTADLYDLLGDLHFKNNNTKKALESWNKAQSLESRNKNLMKKIKEEKFYEPSYF